MESKIEELKAAMPKLADEGILQVDEYFRFASWELWGRDSPSEDESNEDQDTENEQWK
ncbi:hypothetical protein K435DRAFT_841526 [Dendrothele bispora CBS 962.96]|uniref:Uncharacterized protein n=1 Tax=Dendrothele bispora (strain CBS 962.96) TaxID=1314807 RepID=A0A4V4HEA3_DENBC|nr:hypothetical protein K435DRAFT_841526 [Dendrothele bispora CBS 962.96]